MARARRVFAVLIGVVLVMGVSGSLADAAAGRYSKVSTTLTYVSGGGTTLRLATVTAASGENVGRLGVGFTEKAVGSNTTITYVLGLSQYDVALACVNNGNNKTGDIKKNITVPIPDIAPQQAKSSSKGSVTVTPAEFGFTLPLYESSLTCPSGQTPRAVAITLGATTLTDTDNDESVGLGSFVSAPLYKTR